MTNKTTDLQLPPQNLAAERAVIGSMLLDNSVIDSVAQLLKPEDFHADVHKSIFRTIVSDYTELGICDTMTLTDALTSAGQLDEIGGVPYLLEILETVPHAAHATYYAGLVINCAKRRRAVEIGRKLIESAFNQATDLGELCDAAIVAAERLTEIAPNAQNSIRPLSEHVTEVLDNLASGVQPTRFDGIPEIDEQIGGTADGEVIVIAAATSHGKTLVALQWLHEAAQHGTVCGMISEEMSAIGLASRTLASITTIPSDQWIQNIDRVRFDARDHFERSAPIVIAEKCGSIAAVERQTSILVNKFGVKLLAVDYAQLIRGDGGNRQERVADVSTRIKHLAMRHGIRILLLAQLNRAIDLREDPSPQLSDIADTSQIAKDADVVVMPFHPIKVNDEYHDPNEYQIYFRKNRPRGIHRDCIKLTIDRDRQRIVPYRGAPADDGPDPATWGVT